MTKYFSREHEWIEIQDNNEALIGITSYAIEQLGDVVFIEFPSPGTEISAGKECAVIESVKAASELYAPMSGKVLEKNVALEDSPATVNKDNSVWFLKVQLSSPKEVTALMDEKTYQSYITSLET